MQAAEERYQQAKKNPASGLTADHLPVPVTRKPTSPAFARIVSLLHCELLHRILFAVLHNAALDSPRSSDSMLAMALYVASRIVIAFVLFALLVFLFASIL